MPSFSPLKSTLAISILSAGTSFAGPCYESAIVYESKSNLSTQLKKGGFKSAGSNKVNIGIGVFIGDQRGCFSQNSTYQFKVEKSKSANKGSIAIKPPTAEFKNIPNGRVDTYVKIENTGNPWETQLSLVTFICTGEATLSVESFEESFADIKDLAAEAQGNSHSAVIIAGDPATMMNSPAAVAARIAMGLEGSIAQKHQTAIETPTSFVDEFLRQSNLTTQNLEQNLVSLPSVVIQSGSSSPSHVRRQNISTLLVNKSGCTKQFQETMAKYAFNNLPKTIGALSLQRNSDQLRISWGK